MLHQSAFRYALSRPYPYRWFTPIVAVGVIVALVVFSLLHFSSNSLILKTIITTNLNKTLDHDYAWVHKAPWSWGQELNMHCEQSNIVLGTRLFTTNNALSYQLETVLDEDGQALPSLSYSQNVLEDCELVNIDIQFKRADTALLPTGWYTWRFTDAEALMSCRLNTWNGLRYANFSMTLGAHAEDIDFLNDKNDTTTPTKWWGATLIQAYYMMMTSQMARLRINGSTEVAIDYMHVTLQPQEAGTFEDRDFFSGTFIWQTSAGTLHNSRNVQDSDHPIPLSTLYNKLGNETCKSDGSICLEIPDVTNEIEGFASGLYSLMMIDLGQVGGPNVLTNSVLLQRYLSGDGNNRTIVTTENQGTYQTPSKVNARNVKLTDAWADFTDLHDLSSREAVNATIDSQYTCSVPQVRSGISIFLSILVADMAFMTTLGPSPIGLQHGTLYVRIPVRCIVKDIFKAKTSMNWLHLALKTHLNLPLLLSARMLDLCMEHPNTHPLRHSALEVEPLEQSQHSHRRLLVGQTRYPLPARNFLIRQLKRFRNYRQPSIH